MGKSRAEIQKAYRQRLKEKNNEEYLRRERERMRRTYVPSNELSQRDKKRRNELNREKLKRFYDRKRAARHTSSLETSGYESGPSEDNDRGRLRVRLPHLHGRNNRRKGALIRWKRELSEATSRIRLLEQERSKLKTKFKSTQRSLQRIKHKAKTSDKPNHEDTPRKQTENQMKEADLTTPQKEI